MLFTCSLQLGDYALFMPDKYGNYLAITVDSKVYYLDTKSSSTFTIYHELPSKSKFLVGKISSRQHCEVKKVNISLINNKIVLYAFIRMAIVFGYL